MNFQSYDFKHACLILRSEYPSYYSDIVDAIGSFQGPIGRGVSPHPAKAIQDRFVAKGWEKEAPVASGKALKFDVRKGPIAVEIQLADPADCYNDILKFLLAYNLEVIEVGVEVVYADGVRLAGRNLPRLSVVQRALETYRRILACPILGHRYRSGAVK